MAAHLQEATIVEAVLADEDRLHRRLHVVVDAAPAGALEEDEGPIVRVEHHLLRLARIGPHEQHTAMTEPDRVESNTLKLTHEFLAIMLAVRRAGVTEAVNILEEDGLIDLHAGRRRGSKSKGLEKVAVNFTGSPKPSTDDC